MFLFKLIGALTNKTLDRLGDWNPQLLRELKGRFKGFPLLTALGLSFLVQIVFLLGFASALPGAVVAEDLELTTYPQLHWAAASHLPLEMQTVVLPTDEDAQSIIRAKGLFVEYLDTELPVWGDVPTDIEAAGRVQRGDRLLASYNSENE